MWLHTARSSIGSDLPLNAGPAAQLPSAPSAPSPPSGRSHPLAAPAARPARQPAQQAACLWGSESTGKARVEPGQCQLVQTAKPAIVSNQTPLLDRYAVAQASIWCNPKTTAAATQFTSRLYSLTMQVKDEGSAVGKQLHHVQRAITCQCSLCKLGERWSVSDGLRQERRWPDLGQHIPCAKADCMQRSLTCTQSLAAKWLATRSCQYNHNHSQTPLHLCPWPRLQTGAARPPPPEPP